MRTLLVVVVLLLVGCSSAPKTATQSFDISGTKVEFSPPPPDWTQRAPDPQDKDKPKKIVVFEAPENAGYIGVGAVKTNLKEFDQKTLNDLGIDIVSAKGRITNDKYIDVAGEKQNAYRMEFEINSGAAKGIQVHFIRDGRIYSIVMTVKADKFNTAEPIFNNVVSSFTIPGK